MPSSLHSTCSQCHTLLPLGSPAGHCPECLCRISLFVEEAAVALPPAAEPWTRLGDCELYEELGRGGMGIVYRARHRRLGRQMAVKVLRGGELADAGARRHFQAEAATAARLQHPGIVTIHDVGEEQGVCWYSMELISGRTLDDLIRQLLPTGIEAAECLRDIAAAVEHAHHHGVLHRDLKPSNIILDAEGGPHVTDFGIARCMDVATAATRSGSATGSPGYAAPEQVHGQATDVRTDVYGLGGLLYHVLTGRAPFQGPTAEAILVQMRDRDPVRLRALNATVPLDLETICLKALAKEPGRRYLTVKDFREDLKLFLAGRPIKARSVSGMERAWRWAQRRPAWASLLVALGLAISLGAGGIMWQWQKALRSLAAEQESREVLEKNTYAADLRAASLAILDQKQWAQGRSILARHAASPWRGVEWRLLWHAARPQEVARLLPDHSIAVSAVALQEGEASALAASADSSGDVRFWDWRSLQPSPIPSLALQSAVNSLAFLPDGQLLTATEHGGVTSWDLNPRVPVPTAKWPGTMVATSAQGTVLATSDGGFHSWLQKPGRVRVWSPASAAEPWEVPGGGQWITLSPDGSCLAVAGGPDGVTLWDVPSRKLFAHTLTGSGRVWRPRFSSDGLRLAACHSEGAWLWDIAVAEGTLLPHPLFVWAVQFLPQETGGTLITAGADRILRGWEDRLGPRREPAFLIPGSPDEPWCLALSKDGQRILTGVKGGSLHVWKGAGGTEALEVASNRGRALAFSPDCGLFLSPGDQKHGTTLWRVGEEKKLELVHTFSMATLPLGFSGEKVWCIEGNGSWVQPWSVASGEMTEPRYPAPLPKVAHSQLSTDATAAYFIDAAQHVHVMRLADGAQLGAFQLDLPLIIQPALSHGGKYLAINAVGDEGPLHLVEVASGKCRSFKGHRYSVNGVAFSPDGKRLASVASDAKLKIWDTATGVEQFSTSAHLVQASGVAWSADGLTIATISVGEGFKLWHATTGRELVSWVLPTAGSRIGFAPNGQWLTVGLQPSTTAGRARQWLIPAGAEIP